MSEQTPQMAAMAWAHANAASFALKPGAFGRSVAKVELAAKKVFGGAALSGPSSEPLAAGPSLRDLVEHGLIRLEATAPSTDLPVTGGSSKPAPELPGVSE